MANWAKASSSAACGVLLGVFLGRETGKFAAGYYGLIWFDMVFIGTAIYLVFFF